MAPRSRTEVDFHRQIVTDLVTEDALLVLARGLGARSIVRLLVQTYASTTNLVFVINATNDERAAIIEELGVLEVDPLPLVIDADVSVAGRVALYAQRGIFFITARILVVDMLCGRVPLDAVTGFIVCNAHRVTETSTESFILRLYRRSNKRGFIKAVSESAEDFCSGFSKLEKSLKYLCLRRVHLWPRFRVEVSASLEKHGADVVELCQRMTPAMDRIQAAILEVIDACLHELGRANVSIDMTDLTVENAMFKSFDGMMRAQLDPVWHRLGARTKSLVNDIKSLRKLMGYLTSYDAVTFHSFLETLLAGYHSLGNQSPWLLMDAANTVFEVARARVFDLKPDAAAPTAAHPRALTAADVVPVLEENPKWALLAAVLDEIKANQKEGEEGGVVLVAVADDRTCAQLRDVLAKGARSVMERQLEGHLRWRNSLPRLATNVKSARAGGGGASAAPQGRKRKSAAAARFDAKRQATAAANEAETTALAELYAKCLAWFPDNDKQEKATFTARMRRNGPSSASSSTAVPDDADADDEPPADDEEDDTFDINQFNEHFGLLTGTQIVIHTYNDGQSLLWSLRPRYVIMYDPEVSFVRQVEVFRAAHPSYPLRVYFLLYDRSVEEQRYLSAVKKEQTAFERLIRAKSFMSIVDDTDYLDSAVDGQPVVSARQGGGRVVATIPSTVIIDVREFRSSLPFFLFQHNIQIVPTTLEVGDYVLSPEVCVERKSLGDLIQSFASGRLYTQVESMALYYRHPVLLIEFDQERSFELQSVNDLRDDVSIANLSSKLVLLLIHFPALRILWSSSPHQTAAMFAEIKKNIAEPSEEVAAAMGREEGTVLDAGGTIDLVAQELLLRLPGVNTRNYRGIMRKVESVAALTLLTQAELEEIMGPGPARELFTFLHKDAAD